MEYFRDPKNQIYADIAFRLGRIVTQYEKMTTDEEKFEATLYLTVLQNLMTNCNEHVRQMTRGTRRNSIFNRIISKSIWGISEENLIENTFSEKHTLQNFITRMRNSVSHPTKIDIDSKYPSTGFTTIKDNSGFIQKFRFINSPDTTHNRIKEFSSIEAIENCINRGKDEFPEDISYRKIPENEEKFQLISNGEPFIRISIIDLSVKQLGAFVKNLANYLAQPIQENWDGETIKDLLAA